MAQGGTIGVTLAVLDAGHPMIPIIGESENGFRKMIVEHRDAVLAGLSVGQSPGMVAMAMKAAVPALQGNVMPQLISIPILFNRYGELVDDVNYRSDLPDNFFTTNEFAPCGANISGSDIMAQDQSDVN